MDLLLKYFLSILAVCQSTTILNLLLLAKLTPGYSTSSATIGAVIDGEWITSRNGLIQWNNECYFESGDVNYDSILSNTAEECGNQCLNQSLTCNHFNYQNNNPKGCTLMWKPKFTTLKNINFDNWRKGHSCGYIPSQMWQKSSEDDRIVLKSNCLFPSSADGRDVITKKSFISCRYLCLEDQRCVIFSYSGDNNKCVLPHRATEYQKLSIPKILETLFRLHKPTSSSSPSTTCAVVSTRIWHHLFNGALIMMHENCEFKDFDNIAELLSDSSNCRDRCSNTEWCTHYNHYQNGTCYLIKDAAPFKMHRTEAEGGECGYIPEEHNSIKWNDTIKNENVARWRKNCEFEMPIIENIPNITAENCIDKCLTDPICNHFSHDGTDCFFMFEWESANPRFNLIGWTCGSIPSRIWGKSIDDKRILFKDYCTFPLSIDGTTDAINETSLESCRDICLSDHQCNAFSYRDSITNGRECVLPYKELKFETNRNLSSLTRLFLVRSPSRLVRSECYVIPSRNWKVDLIEESGDGVLYQDDCDFHKGVDIGNSL